MRPVAGSGRGERGHRGARDVNALGHGSVRAVAASINTPEGRAAALAACPSPEVLVNNPGGLPSGDFHQFDEAAWLAALRANRLTPIELMKATVDGTLERGFGRIVNITSAVLK